MVAMIVLSPKPGDHLFLANGHPEEPPRAMLDCSSAHMPDRKESELAIAEEPIDVIWNGKAYELPCAVTFNIAKGTRIVTAPLEVKIAPIPSLEDDYKVRRKAGGQMFDVMATAISQEITDGLSVRWHFVPRVEPVCIDDASPLRSVRFAVANFGEFYTQYPDQPGLQKNRLELAGDGWVLKLEPMNGSGYGDVTTAESTFFVFTHSSCLTRQDDESFSCEQAHSALDLIASFLSFCRGRWVAPGLVKGFTADGAIGMQEWGTRLIEPYTECATWLDRMQGQEMAKAFAGYMRKATDPDWQEAIYTAIYWYTRTNGTASGVDGSIILLQAALERLAWQMLVQHKNVLSKDGFTRLPAADQLRLLLDYCYIPLAIPSGLKELESTAAAFNWTDGPQAFVEMRNSMVHPPKKDRNPKPLLAISDAWRLGQWYLELVLLKLFEFGGKYANRTREHQYVGQVEDVPWA
jgi:hypothetical protein